jgi:LuxR family transcriptional regulator, regulator of acetate metabolism
VLNPGFDEITGIGEPACSSTVTTEALCFGPLVIEIAVTPFESRSLTCVHYDSPVVGEEGIHGVMAVPLYTGERVLGVLYAATHAITDLGDRAADALVVVARDASCALTVAERAQHAAEVAAHEERRRIAMSLHDSVGASLFALTASVRRLGDDVVEFPALRAKLDAIAERASDASAALRASLRALSTPREELVMAVALRATCASFQQRSGVLARLILMDELPDVPQPRSEALVTAAREALLNVEKHAQARSVVVSAFPVRGGLAVAVADDGIGVAAADSDGLGIGLRGVEEQLERVGGTLSLRDGEDGGTTVHAWVPT